MADTAQDNGNGRVTMALLGAKVDAVACDVTAILARLERMDQRQTDTNNMVLRHDEQIKQLSTRDYVASLAAAITAALGAFFAWMLGVRQ